MISGKLEFLEINSKFHPSTVEDVTEAIIMGKRADLQFNSWTKFEIFYKSIKTGFIIAPKFRRVD